MSVRLRGFGLWIVFGLCGLGLSGCTDSSTPPGSVNFTSVEIGDSVASICQFGDRVTLIVWFDEATSFGGGYVERNHGFTGAARLFNGQVRTWSCQTRDGIHGQITWWGNSLPENASETSNLEKGAVLLVSTNGGRLSVQQVPHQFPPISPDERGIDEARRLVKELAQSDQIVKDFLAGPATSQKSELEGTWDLVSLERDGEAVNVQDDTRLVITGNRFEVRVGDKVIAAGMNRLNRELRPATVDATYTVGPDQGHSFKGIYQLDEDTLKFCRGGAPEQERPRAFQTTAENRGLLSVYRRRLP
ncbi:MAG: TIGR03067 domain-containing protein [Planctomycetes bacterium]|nr:TIGR03067 domain-containing protein [Planctomycetota bacterium]